MMQGTVEYIEYKQNTIRCHLYQQELEAAFLPQQCLKLQCII